MKQKTPLPGTNPVCSQGTVSGATHKPKPMDISQAEVIHSTADFFEQMDDRPRKCKVIRSRYLSTE